MLGFIGPYGGLALLIYMTMRGMYLLIAAPLSALFVTLLNGQPLFPQPAEEGAANFLTNYMTGFSGIIASWYLMFLTGAIFGKCYGRPWSSRQYFQLDRIPNIRYRLLGFFLLL